MCVWGNRYVTTCIWRSEDTLCNRFSPFIWTWVSGCHTCMEKWLYPLSQFTDPCICFMRQGLSLTETVFYNLTRLISQWALEPACLYNFITLAFHMNLWGPKHRCSCLLKHISSSSLLSVEFVYAFRMRCSTAQVHYTLVNHALGKGHLWNCDIATMLSHLSFRHTQEWSLQSTFWLTPWRNTKYFSKVGNNLQTSDKAS